MRKYLIISLIWSETVHSYNDRVYIDLSLSIGTLMLENVLMLSARISNLDSLHNFPVPQSSPDSLRKIMTYLWLVFGKVVTVSDTKSMFKSPKLLVITFQVPVSSNPDTSNPLFQPSSFPGWPERRSSRLVYFRARWCWCFRTNILMPGGSTALSCF